MPCQRMMTFIFPPGDWWTEVQNGKDEVDPVSAVGHCFVSWLKMFYPRHHAPFGRFNVVGAGHRERLIPRRAQKEHCG
jgi:hypothetical protein